MALLSGCGGEPDAALRVGPVAFTESQLLGLSPERREVLSVLTGFGLSVAQGAAETLGEPLVERDVAEELARRLVAERVLEEAGVDDEVLRARYGTAPRWELTVRHLILLSERWRPEAHRAEARRKATAALERIRAGEAFPEVAAQTSEEPGAEGRQGLLTPGREGAWVPEFWQAANALETGQISGVVETQYGFHVIRLEGRDTVPFQEARSDLVLEVASLLDPATLTAGDALPLPPYDPAPGLLEGTAPEGGEADAVATWEGGSLDAGEWQRHLATLDRRAWAEAMEGGTDARRAALEEAVRLDVARERAGARGLGLSGDARAALGREWSDTATRWATSLGFEAGLDAETLAARALEALGSTRQGAAIARDELMVRAPLVLHAHGLTPAAAAAVPGSETVPGPGT